MLFAQIYLWPSSTVTNIPVLPVGYLVLSAFKLANASGESLICVSLAFMLLVKSDSCASKRLDNVSYASPCELVRAATTSSITFFVSFSSSSKRSFTTLNFLSLTVDCRASITSLSLVLPTIWLLNRLRISSTVVFASLATAEPISMPCAIASRTSLPYIFVRTDCERNKTRSSTRDFL